MHTGDLTAGANKLRLAMEAFTAAWDDAHQTWSDKRAQKFEETYLLQLAPRAQAALEAANRMADILSKAQRDCES